MSDQLAAEVQNGPSPARVGSEPWPISVIIPVFNCERYIGDAVRSVREQTYPVHEIIVVDDGSTDGTRAALAAHRSAIQYIRCEHRGVAAARNTGIARSSGEFIAFLDADDLWLPEKLAMQVDYFRAHADCGLVYTDMKLFDETGILQESVKQYLHMDPPSGWIFPQLFAETLFAADAVMFRKKCLDRVGNFEERLGCGEDYHMWLRFSRHFRIGYLDKPLVMYRQHPAMTTRSIAVPDGVPWESRVIESVLELYPEIKAELGRNKVRKRLAKPYFYSACACLQAGDHRQARRFFGRALRRWPWSGRCALLALAACMTPKQLRAAKRLYRRMASAPEPEQARRAAASASG